MTKLQKFSLFSLIVITLGVVKVLYFPNVNIIPDLVKNIQPKEEINTHQKDSEEENGEQQQQDDVQKEDDPALKMFVNVYFIGQNKNNQEVYKIVRRSYNPNTDGSKIEFAIKNLIKGPSAVESKSKVYSEIPKGTKLLSITEKANMTIINLSSEFEQGGGTDSLYKRLYQLIKTANRNTNKDVYLKINGVQVEVIGGEGIMITQPLNNNSLGE